LEVPFTRPAEDPFGQLATGPSERMVQAVGIRSSGTEAASITNEW